MKPQQRPEQLLSRRYEDIEDRLRRLERGGSGGTWTFYRPKATVQQSPDATFRSWGWYLDAGRVLVCHGVVEFRSVAYDSFEFRVAAWGLPPGFYLVDFSHAQIGGSGVAEASQSGNALHVGPPGRWVARAGEFAFEEYYPEPGDTLSPSYSGIETAQIAVHGHHTSVYGSTSGSVGSHYPFELSSQAADSTYFTWSVIYFVRPEREPQGPSEGSAFWPPFTYE